MENDTDILVEKLGESYARTLPLLNYLKARLKYDTVRWIRTYGTKDDIVFSTRIKTFERVFDKLVRRGVPLSKTADLLDIALSGKGTLDDLIGIRFICFDAFQIYRLVSYFLITERVTTSKREFYVSSKADAGYPIYRFLQSNGFTPIQKEGREYEDINFIIRFSHPIDKYFGSGLESFSSLAQRADSSPQNEKLTAVNALFEALKNESPNLISAIAQLPIECQIVTATQHIYNRTQRPQYEYILQAKNGDAVISAKEAADLADRLNVLKLSLLAADINVFSVHKTFGIRYEAPSRISPGHLFKLDGRLPKDILEENYRIEEINMTLLNVLISPDSMTLKRKRALGQIFKDLAIINRKITERSQAAGDIAAGDLLHITDLDEISHPTIVFWCFQRVIILIICVVLLYSHDELINAEVVAKLLFGSERHRLSDIDIVLGRLFENLEHVDNAINAKISTPNRKISGWKEGYFSNGVFSDPLIQWRYASFMYRKREYDNALQEIKVGIAIHEQLNEWKRKGASADFAVPEVALYERRSVEYDLCAEISKLKFSPVAVAGVLELCNCVLSRSEEWIAKLNLVIDQTQDLSERVRCVCFQILFRLCSLSAGGLKGPILDALHEEFKQKFDDLETAIARKGKNGIKDRTWWLLAKAIMAEGNTTKLLDQFKTRSNEVAHHPPERKHFETACAVLIALWKPSTGIVTDRSDFAVNALTLLREQTERLAKSDAISQAALEQSRIVTNLLAEILRELREKGKVTISDRVKKKIGDLPGDIVENIIVDTAVSALRSVLGV